MKKFSVIILFLLLLTPKVSACEFTLQDLRVKLYTNYMLFWHGIQKLNTQKYDAYFFRTNSNTNPKSVDAVELRAPNATLKSSTEYFIFFEKDRTIVFNRDFNDSSGQCFRKYIAKQINDRNKE